MCKSCVINQDGSIKQCVPCRNDEIILRRSEIRQDIMFEKGVVLKQLEKELTNQVSYIENVIFVDFKNKKRLN